MKLRGKINGVDIALIHQGFGVYTAVIPRQVTGIYIVELHVEDNGWVDSFSHVFVRVDFRSMQVKFLNSAYTWTEGDTSYGFRAIETPIAMKPINEDKYVIAPIPQRYAIRGV